MCRAFEKANFPAFASVAVRREVYASNVPSVGTSIVHVGYAGPSSVLVHDPSCAYARPSALPRPSASSTALTSVIVASSSACVCCYGNGCSACWALVPV